MAVIALQTADKIDVVESFEQLTGIAGANLTAGNLVRIDANGEMVLADSGAAGTADPIGMALRTVLDGEPVTVLRRGVIEGFEIDGVAFGAPLFLNPAGAVGDGAGVVSVVIGNVIPAHGELLGSGHGKLILLEVNAT